MELEVVARQRADVHQAVDLQALELHEDAEVGDAGRDRVEFLTDAVLHELALQEGHHRARRLVGLALAQRALLAEQLHLARRVHEVTGIAAAERMANGAMHQQVGVAAYRRGKVDILRQRQPEMADVERLVECLWQGTNDRVLEHGRVGPLAHLLEHLLQPLRLEITGQVEVQAAQRQEALQVLHAVFLGHPVDAEQRRHAMALEEACRLDVGGDHALLDHAVRVVARVGADAGDPAGLVDQHLELGRLEIQRATRLAPAPQRAVHLVQGLQHGQHGRQFGARGRIAFHQRRRHAAVGEARRRTHQCRIEARARYPALAADAHLADHAQSRHLRHQRTQLVRQLLGQHRHHPLREVNRRRSLARLGVERAAWRDVVAHVRDRHQQPEAAAR